MTKRKRYVHLVFASWDYEGYDRPEAAFMRERDADALAYKLNRRPKSMACRYEVVSVEIKPKGPPRARTNK